MRTALTASLALGILLFLGCGKDNAGREQREDERIVALVTGTPDKALNPAVAKDHFATVPAKAELRKYAELSFEPAGNPNVSGGMATILVKVSGQDGSVKGEVTWEFVKDGDRWKLKNAPLP